MKRENKKSYITLQTSQNKGITLVALIITIIVLLILAGVTIATLTGDNGILTQAGKAKEEILKQGIIEEIEIAILSLEQDSENKDKDYMYTNENLNKYLQGKVFLVEYDYRGIKEVIYEYKNERYRIIKDNDKWELQEIEYNRLKYLIFRSYGQGYSTLINTKVIPTESMRVEIKIEDLLKRENWGCEIFGTEWSNNGFFLLGKQPGYDWRNRGEAYQYAKNIERGIDTIECYKNTIKVNGILYKSEREGAFSQDNKPILIGTFSKIRPACFKFYYMRIYDDNGILISDLVPALDSNNEVTLYDVVRKEYLYNCQGDEYAGKKGSFGISDWEKIF